MRKILLIVVLMTSLIPAAPSEAQDIVQLQDGVMKITAKSPEGSPRIGTGFIVRLESDVSYIVTAHTSSLGI